MKDKQISLEIKGECMDNKFIRAEEVAQELSV